MKCEPPAEGLHRETYANGKPSQEFTIKNGEQHGLFRDWYENGQLATQGLFKNGRQDGKWSQWNSDGKLLGTDIFKNGTGISRQWHPNGTLSAEISHYRGSMTGPMKFWAPDGMLYGTKFFFEGRPISKKRYLGLCSANPALPPFVDKKETNTFANFARELRKKQRAKAKLGPTAEDLEANARYDDDCAAESRPPWGKEIIAWFTKGKLGGRELGELGRAQALKLAKKLYGLGAVTVWATRIERDVDGFECSRRLIVKLPPDAEKRSRIYKLCSDAARPTQTTGLPAIYTGRQFMSVSLL